MENYINNECLEAINEGRKIPAKINGGEFKIKYIATDGWRGYHKATPTKKSGWVEIDSDWVTGNWEDAGENASSRVEDKIKKLIAKVEKLGGEFLMVMLPTSNVFSTAYDVFVKNLTAKEIDFLNS